MITCLLRWPTPPEVYPLPVVLTRESKGRPLGLRLFALDTSSHAMRLAVEMEFSNSPKAQEVSE